MNPLFIVGRVADESLGEPTEEFRVSQKFTETLAEVPIVEKISLGHRIEDTVLECSFRGRQCKNMWVDKSHDITYMYYSV